MSNLRKLIEAVEKGEEASPPIGNVFGFTPATPLASKAYHGSLDAAKALHDMVLPGWEWRLRSDGRAAVWRTASDMRETEADTTARAWLLAILRALEAHQ